MPHNYPSQDCTGLTRKAARPKGIYCIAPILLNTIKRGLWQPNPKTLINKGFRGMAKNASKTLLNGGLIPCKHLVNFLIKNPQKLEKSVTCFSIFSNLR